MTARKEEGRDAALAAGDAGAAKEDLMAFALKSGALVAGVASADSFEDAPEGFRPADLLPGAKSVVVVGGAQPRAGDWASTIPEHMETMGVGDRINSLGLKIAKYIETKFGYYALYVPPGLNKGNRPFLSIAMAAERAGCGSQSLAGPVLNQRFGFMYYSAIITTLSLPASPLPDAPACPAPECLEMWEEKATTPCMDICPIGDNGCIGGKIEDGRVVERQYDKARCTSRVYTHWVPGFQKSLEAALNEDDKEKRKMILYGSFFSRTLWSITYASQSQAQCAECMRVCPAGKEMRTKK